MKLLLAILILLIPKFANAATTFYIQGAPYINQSCDVPFGGGPCVQLYQTDQGHLEITVDGESFFRSYYADIYSYAGFVGLSLASQIQERLGLVVTVTCVDGWGSSSDIGHCACAAVTIDGDHSLSNAKAVQDNPALGTWTSWSIWY